jgi:parallel beta-helix repeat protein
MKLPVHQVGKGQPWPAQLLIQPDTKVMQGHLRGQARLQSTEGMGPFPIQAERSDNGDVGFWFEAATGPILAQANTASDSSFSGFLIQGFSTGRVLLEDNTALRNPGSGFTVLGNSRHRLIRNTASSNNFTGFDLLGSGHTFNNNTAVGNQGAGLAFGAGSGEIEVHANNIFGNGSTTELNCGVTNQSEHEIDAQNNFWGAASGPGPDPADDAGAGTGCDSSVGSVTVVHPFAREPFPIKP